MVDSPTPQPTPPTSAPAAPQTGVPTDLEQSRQQALAEAQSKAFVESRMRESGLGGTTLPTNGPSVSLTPTPGGAVPIPYGREDEPYDPVEALRQGQASARRSNEAEDALAQIEQAKGEVDKQIQEQTNSVNFYILQFTTDLMAFDMSCFGLTLPITLPIYDLLIVPILGMELYHAWNGTPSLIPYFPKLTWQSFMKPGGGGETPPVPLPQTVLCVLVFFVMLLLGLLTLLEAGFIAAVIYAWQNPTEAGQMLSGFLGMPSIPGL